MSRKTQSGEVIYPRLRLVTPDLNPMSPDPHPSIAMPPTTTWPQQVNTGGAAGQRITVMWITKKNQRNCSAKFRESYVSVSFVLQNHTFSVLNILEISKNLWLKKKSLLGNSLVVQGLGLSTFTAGAKSWSLVGELRSCRLHGLAKKKKKKSLFYTSNQNYILEVQSNFHMFNKWIKTNVKTYQVFSFTTSLS